MGGRSRVTMLYGCEGCRGTAGRLGCPTHGSSPVTVRQDFDGRRDLPKKDELRNAAGDLLNHVYGLLNQYDTEERRHPSIVALGTAAGRVARALGRDK